VDYTRSPGTTGSAAIDPLFSATAITNKAGQTDYPFYWSSTTHANWINGMNAAYVAFGRSLGYMNGTWIDVHGAGSQRSDPKSGDPADWPTGHGPQGDAIRIYNYVRCVRGGVSSEIITGDEADPASHSLFLSPWLYSLEIPNDWHSNIPGFLIRSSGRCVSWIPACFDTCH
jgi:hypothetical protein